MGEDCSTHALHACTHVIVAFTKMNSKLALTFLSFALVGLATAELSHNQVLLTVLALFALCFASVKLEIESKFVAVGYVLWVTSYLYQIGCILTHKQSAWPIVAGGYYLQNEFVVAFTTWFDSAAKHQYTTPKFVRMGYKVFFAFDFVLSALTVYYGTGAMQDEFQVFQTETPQQRFIVFAAWFMFSLVLTLGTLKTGDPRQAKYWCYAIHFVAHCLIIRLPNGLSAEQFNVKLQIFGNACFAVRYASSTLPFPQDLYRALIFAMPVFSALTTPFQGNLFQAMDIVNMEIEDLRLCSAIWLASVWVSVVFISEVAKRGVFSKHSAVVVPFSSRAQLVKD